ncbi:MAG: DUF547 domain-containing protein [Pseudomonadota bacterium]
MKRFFLLCWLCAQCALAQAAGFDHAQWDQLLKKHVTVLNHGQSSQVDYAGMALERNALDQYLSKLAKVSQADFDQWDRPSQLAFLINAYNATTVSLVLTRYPNLVSIKDLGSVFQSAWKKPFIGLLGQMRSLDDIEHGLIRGSGRYADPRVHFAANCASIGCPALRAEAYQAARLEIQLDDATKAFLSDRSRNRLQQNTLALSSIFKWYRSDFEMNWRGASSMARFLANYGQALGLSAIETERLVRGEISIEFLDYDWRLNARAPRS